MVLVGATLTGSIIIKRKSRTIQPRGGCHGEFRFGGSTVILLFEKGRVALDGDLLQNSLKEKVETLVTVNSRIGVATRVDFNVALGLEEERIRQKASMQTMPTGAQPNACCTVS